MLERPSPSPSPWGEGARESSVRFPFSPGRRGGLTPRFAREDEGLQFNCTDLLRAVTLFC
jgi:hypothetical protein